jgi:hypothetical protein
MKIADVTVLDDKQIAFRLELFSDLSGNLKKRITPTERRIMAVLMTEAASRLRSDVQS